MSCKKFKKKSLLKNSRPGGCFGACSRRVQRGIAMADLTRVFRKYVQVIREETGARKDGGAAVEAVSTAGGAALGGSLKDTFVKECYELYRCLRELQRVLRAVEPDYRDQGDSVSMREGDKTQFDTEFRLQLQRYLQKFKQLQKYEAGREQLIEEELAKGSSAFQALGQWARARGSTGGKHLDHESLVRHHTVNSKYRNGVLDSLNLMIRTISTKFMVMQQERLRNQKKFELLEFAGQGNAVPFPSGEAQARSPVGGDDGGLNEEELAKLQTVQSNISISQSSQVESVQDEVKLYEETVSKLTQEQLQLLQVEHDELLNQKDEQLQNVENINKTIMDIVSLQSELSQHLQVQSQNINSMLDNQDQIEYNIEKGNKQLAKAQRNASKSAKMITYIAIIMALFILFVDFIN